MALTKEGLERSVTFEVRDDSENGAGDGLTLTGHAAVFNVKTEINSWEGTFLEDIAPGAFKKTIRERTPVMQFDHGRHPLIGSIPIGSISSLAEDETGLAVEGRLTDNWLIEPIRDAIREKTVQGMSFRFDVIREEWRDNSGKILKDPDEIWRLMWDAGDRGPIERTLKELRVHELGPVVFPAYRETDVSVRSAVTNLYNDPKSVRWIRQSLAVGDASSRDLLFTDKIGEIANAILFRDTPSDFKPRAIDAIMDVQIPAEDLEKIGRDLKEGYNRYKTEFVDKPVEKPLVIEDAPVRDDHPSPAKDKDLRARMHYASRRMQRVISVISEEE